MVKIGVFSDTHIGRTVPNVVAEYRRRAFRHAFKQAVDIFIEEGVEYVVHGGDVFERRSMTPGDTKFVKEEFQRLVDGLGGEVKILVVRGNHDGTPENSALDYVEHPLAKYLKVIGDGALKGEVNIYEDDGIAAVGYGYTPYAAVKIGEVEEAIRKRFEETSAEHKIFIIHAFIEDHQDIPPGVPEYQIVPKKVVKNIGADLIVAGHHHQHVPPTIIDGVSVLTPGATEAVDLSDETIHGVTIIELGERFDYSFRPLTPLYRIRNAVVDSAGAVREPAWYMERTLIAAREFSERLKAEGAEGLMRLALKGVVKGDKFELEENVEKELRRLMEENSLLLHIVLKNDLRQAGTPLSVTETTSRSEFLSEVFKPLGEKRMEAALQLLDEVEFTLGEKASTKTGLLRDSDRRRFVERWIKLLEAETNA